VRSSGQYRRHRQRRGAGRRVAGELRRGHVERAGDELVAVAGLLEGLAEADEQEEVGVVGDADGVARVAPVVQRDELLVDPRIGDGELAPAAAADAEVGLVTSGLQTRV
jgi:hypothetical protein